MKPKHYDLQKIYYGLLANDPLYPAWQDFECADELGNWYRLGSEPSWYEQYEYRYNPLPKKWEPRDGWMLTKCISVSKDFTAEDQQRLQAYATKLSWLREQGGYEFKLCEENFYHYLDIDGDMATYIDQECPNRDSIYMNKAQAEKWLEMVKNGEV